MRCRSTARSSGTLCWWSPSTHATAGQFGRCFSSRSAPRRTSAPVLNSAGSLSEAPRLCHGWRRADSAGRTRRCTRPSLCSKALASAAPDLMVVFADSDTAWAGAERDPVVFVRAMQRRLGRAFRVAGDPSILLAAELVRFECGDVCGIVPAIPERASSFCPHRISPRETNDLKPLSPQWLNSGMYAGRAAALLNMLRWWARRLPEVWKMPGAITDQGVLYRWAVGRGKATAALDYCSIVFHNLLGHHAALYALRDGSSYGQAAKVPRAASSERGQVDRRGASACTPQKVEPFPACALHPMTSVWAWCTPTGSASRGVCGLASAGATAARHRVPATAPTRRMRWVTARGEALARGRMWVRMAASWPGVQLAPDANS